jgi:hypothetical protein
MRQALGMVGMADGKLSVGQPIKAKRLQKPEPVGIFYSAAAVFECRPLRCVTSARAFSFRWRTPPPAKMLVVERIAFGDHRCGIAHHAATRLAGRPRLGAS